MTSWLCSLHDGLFAHGKIISSWLWYMGHIQESIEVWLMMGRPFKVGHSEQTIETWPRWAGYGRLSVQNQEVTRMAGLEWDSSQILYPHQDFAHGEWGNI